MTPRVYFSYLTKLAAVVLACLSTTAALYAQPAPFRVLGIKDGLPQGTVTCTLQDREGYVWAGTKDGLTRYDGYSFETVRYIPGDTTSLSSNNITAISQDLSGNIWVGTNFGLNRLDPEALTCNRFYHWFEDDRSLSSNKVTAITTDHHGNVWIGTDNGLNRYDSKDGGFTAFSIRENDPFSLSGNRVNTIYADERNQLWVGTDAGLNLYLPEGTFKRYKRDFNDDNSLSDNIVLSIAEDFDGHLWIGTRNGLNRFQPDLEIFTRYYADHPKPGLLNSSIINAVLTDKRGQIWVGTPAGLSRLYRKTREDDEEAVQGSLSFEDLPNSHISTLMTDRSGLIWVGTLTAGIATFNDEAQKFFAFLFSDHKKYLPEHNKNYCFMRDSSAGLLVGTGSGIMQFQKVRDPVPDRFQWKPVGKIGNAQAMVRDLERGTDGRIWAATDGDGLLELDPADFTVINRYTVQAEDREGIPVNKISAVIPEEGGDLWVGTLGAGFCKYSAETDRFRTFRFSGEDRGSLRDNNITCMRRKDERTLWIGTGNSGVYRFDTETERLERFAQGEIDKGVLGSGIINDIYLDRNDVIWVATSGGGLARYEGNGIFTSFTSEDGLASDVVQSIRCDFEGNLWVSTNGGISVFNPETSVFRNYNENDMPGSNTFFAGSAFRGDENRIFFGGANGFTYFYAEGLRENRFIPPVVIRRFSMLRDDVLRSDSGRSKSPRERIKLKHNHPGFTIEFAALNFKQPEKNRYAYRLLGLSDEWRYMGTRRFATFSNLSPGNYTFEVRGSNNDGYWNETPASITFTVQHAFWQTASFKVAVAFLLLLALYAIYRYRIRLEKERRSALEAAVVRRTAEIAKERDTNAVLLREVHHRVKNNLQIIVSLLSLQSRFIRDEGQVKVFNEVQNRVRSMSLIHQKMYQSKDLSTVNIAEYIRDLSENLLKTYNVNRNIKLDINVEVNRFKSDTLTPLGLIINEIMSNALKYAFQEDTEGSVFVEITKCGNGRYRMVIGDDGIGLPFESDEEFTETSGSFGTELIHALTEQLNGSIKLLRERKGTVYLIDFEDVEE